MCNLIDVMRDARFNCEKTAELLGVYHRLEVTPLIKAATLGLRSAVKDLLASGVDATIRSCRGDMSALEAAALMRHLGVVRALVEHGVDVNNDGSGGQTALHTAVHEGRADRDLIDLLLSAGADIDARTAKGYTALHFAADRPDSGDVTTILLQRGTAKDALIDIGLSPLHLAAASGNVAATRALLAFGADTTLRVYRRTMTPLDLAAENGKGEVIRELARHGVDLDAAHAKNGWTAMYHAIRMNKPSSVGALVEAGASIDAQINVGRGGTPLHIAADSLAFDATLELLRHGALARAQSTRASQDDETSGRDGSPLHCAARMGGTKGAAEMVDLLLRWGADESELNRDGNTPAEVVGDCGMEEYSIAADTNRVRELLANAPADRVWRRRGLLLLCLAHNRTMRRRKRSGRESLWKGKEALAKDGGGGGGSSNNGCSGGGGLDGSEGGGDSGDVVPMLLEYEEEWLIRTIVGYL